MAEITTKIDWLEAQKDFISDNTMRLIDVAKKYGVSDTAVEERAKREGWAELRTKLGEKAMDLFAEKLVKVKAQANAKHAERYNRLQKLADRAMNEMETSKKVSPVMLSKLASTLRSAIDGERIVLGLPTSVSVHQDPDGKPVQAVTIYNLRADNADQSETGTPTTDT